MNLQSIYLIRPCHYETDYIISSTNLYWRQYFIKNLKRKINIKQHLQFDQARDLIRKLIKRRLSFHLVLINNCNVKITHKRSSLINSIYSGQQQISYIFLKHLAFHLHFYLRNERYHSKGFLLSFLVLLHFLSLARVCQ